MSAIKVTANDVMSRVLKSARANKGLTQAKAAKLTGITQTALSRREKCFDEMKADDIYVYCRVIGADPVEVFGRFCQERRNGR